MRQHGSSPKLQVLNRALLTAQSGATPAQTGRPGDRRGRLIESAVGAHLANAALAGECELFYWRERNREVDLMVRRGSHVTAIEVKGGRGEALSGMAAFSAEFSPRRQLLIGVDGIALEELLSRPVSYWVANLARAPLGRNVGAPATETGVGAPRSAAETLAGRTPLE